MPHSAQGDTRSEHSAEARWSRVADALASSCAGRAPATGAPQRGAVGGFVDLARAVLFPGFFAAAGGDGAPARLRENIPRLEEALADLVRDALRVAEPYAQDADARAGDIAAAFVEGLPALRETLLLDARASFDGDPAARLPEEVVLCYPGLEATMAYRVANALLRQGAPILPRMITEDAHSRTGIDIHPGAEIGRSFFIDHGTGVVIGETTVIGEGVTLYQGVTLGARNFPKDGEGRVIRGIKRHPTVGDGVTIYAGAVILGGDTVVGDGCVISANVHLSRSVPAGHVVRQHKGELQMLPTQGGGQ